MTSKMIYLEGLFSEVSSPDHHLKVCHCNVDQLSIGFIAQLVEHCSGITEVMGSNPVQGPVSRKTR